MKNNFICAIDIGASKLSGVVGIFNKTGKITSLIMEAVSSGGLKNGRIVDFACVSSNLESLLKKLENSSQAKIKEIYVNVSGSEITTSHSRAIIPLVERGNRVITDSDVNRVTEQAIILGTSLQQEIIHQVPCGFIVDSDNYCKDPRQLYAHRLEIDLLLIYAKLSYIQSVARLAGQLGCSVKGIFYPGFINGTLALNYGSRIGIDFFCDIGADTTDLIMFKDAALQNIEVLPMGGNSITQAISYHFNIPFDLADEIKHSSAVIGNFDDVPEEKEVMVTKGSAYMPIKQKEISRIATQEAVKICSDIKAAMDRMSAEKTVNSLFVCGRAVLQEGFLEKLEETTGSSVRLLRIPGNLFLNNEICNELASSCIKTLTYLNSFGMVAYVIESMQLKERLRKLPTIKSISGIAHKIKQVYQQYF